MWYIPGKETTTTNGWHSLFCEGRFPLTEHASAGRKKWSKVIFQLETMLFLVNVVILQGLHSLSSDHNVSLTTSNSGLAGPITLQMMFPDTDYVLIPGVNWVGFSVDLYGF